MIRPGVKRTAPPQSGNSPRVSGLLGAMSKLNAGWRKAGSRGPSQWTVALALAVEIGLFLWLAIALTVPWQVVLPPATIVAVALGAIAVRGRSRSRRPWPVAAALGLGLVLDVLLGAFLALILFLIIMQGALAGKGITPLLVAPLIMALAIFLDVGLPLIMVLAFVLVMALGVLMDSGPVAFLAVPFVLSIGVAAVLFQAISPDRGVRMSGLPGRHGNTRRTGYI